MTISPKQTATLNVTFTPKSAAASTGALTITSNAARHTTEVVPLSGTGTSGTTSTLAVSVSSLSFGTVNDGSSATLPVTLTSTGTGAVTINSSTISGTGFTVSGATFPLTLNPSLAVTLQVKFSPTAGGAATGSLAISSNSSKGSSSVVSLSGTGQYLVDLSWAAPGSSPEPVTGYNVYRATGTSSSYQLLNPSPNSLTTYVDSSVQPNTAYSYYVESVDSANVASVPSKAISLTTP
jgi:hypothetical protein